MGYGRSALRDVCLQKTRWCSSSYSNVVWVSFMKSSLCLLALILAFAAAGRAQRTGGADPDKPYATPRVVDLAGECRSECFFRGWANAANPEIFLVTLRQNQKIQISGGFRPLPPGIVDRHGEIDLDGNAITVIAPNGKIIKHKSDDFILAAVTAGTYKIVVRPRYAKVLSDKIPALDHDYRIDFTLRRRK